jgi:flagellar biogenesis protein FliO
VITLASTAVGLALALLGAGMVWSRRQQDAGPSAIALVATRYLGGKRYLTLVEVDGQRLLLGLSDERVSLVARLDGTTSVEPRA